MLKKHKSILLGSFSISMLVAMPIVITSCGSSINSSNNSSSTENPSVITVPNFSKDDTNIDTFVPNNGLYKHITKDIDSHFAVEISNLINDSIANYQNVNNEDIKDIIKMWSFNKWLSTKNVSKISNSFISRLSDFDISKNTNSTWNISFNYEIKVTIKENNKDIVVYGKKNYSTNSGLISSMKFDTNSSLIIVDGKDETNLTNYNDSNNQALKYNDVKTVVNFLRSKESNIMTYDISKEFIANKGIKSLLGTWNNVNLVDGVSLSSDKRLVDVDLNKIKDSWYGLNNQSTMNDVIKAIIKNNNSKQELADSFKALINDSKNLIKTTNVNYVTEPSSIEFRILLSKETGFSNLVKINFKNFK